MEQLQRQLWRVQADMDQHSAGIREISLRAHVTTDSQELQTLLAKLREHSDGVIDCGFRGLETLGQRETVPNTQTRGIMRRAVS